ncbi:hypothetical protein FRC06_005203 [Ceratobasidium sp. 370]|nr:hypothetical protein FRC06_005203 [Ceratobasidium sp. 370]
MPAMQYHVLGNIACTNPWPDPERRTAYLSDAQTYATMLTGVSGDDVFTPKFLNTVLYRASTDRANSLEQIQFMIKHEFGVTSADKDSLYRLMSKDLFLYPSIDQNPSEYFCTHALGSALEIILFQCSKNLGLVFMEDLCKPDDADKCAHWHRKLRDRGAREGVPPGLLAFAASQMYWALEKMYLGGKLQFDEQHYRKIWDRYFRVLIKLPHLSWLRVDMLERLKDYYTTHWPAEEPDEDDESFPAW